MWEARAQGVDAIARGAVAFLENGLASRDSVVAAAQAAAPPAPFTLRRIVNPRYRPPSVGLPGIAPATHSRLRALDHFRARLFQQAPSSPRAFTQWEVQGGEQYRGEDGVEVAAGGAYRAGEPELNGLRLSARHGALEGSLMDVEPVAIGPRAFLTRLRGAVARYTDPRGSRWIALGGAPTPIPNLPTPRLALGGLVVEGVRFEDAELSAQGFAFWRGGQRATPGAPGADTLPGRGLSGGLGWRAPLAAGWIGGRLGAQLHSLEGRRALAAQHALEWSYRGAGLTASVSDERGTRRLRVLGTDRIAPAPRREDRCNFQGRFAGGRGEAHLTGVARDGGDPALASRALQLGASGSLGHTSWYGGTDAVWDWRAITASEERRLSLYGGGVVGRGHALLGRLEHAARGADRDLLTALLEASFALPRGARLGLEPRLGWSGGVLGQGDVAARFSWPLGWMSSRVAASLAAGASRDDGNRCRVREGTLSISWAPRLRDRADLEVRRFDDDGRPRLETSLSYDASIERYETPGGGWFAGRDTGRVTVRVVRSGNGSGVADILISLDGKELRFTDADGVARFERVTPGVHVVALEERSLPDRHEVAYASRVFVTVEPGRVPEAVQFAIAPSQRRTTF